MNENVDRVKEFHNRLLSELDDHQHQAISSQLAALTSETSRLTRNLKNRIHSLQSSISHNQGVNNGDANVRATQVGALKKRFMDSIMKYAAHLHFSPFSQLNIAHRSLFLSSFKISISRTRKPTEI